MLNFETFSLAALREALPYIRQNPSRCGDLSAGYLYMWHEGADLRFCVWNGTFCVRQTVGEQTAFSYPYGADPAGMTEELIAYARAEHLPLRFFAVDEGTLEAIRSDGRLQPATYAYDRRWSDYIYEFEAVASLKGRKYSGHRNHINRFKKLYGEPEIRFLTETDRPAVEALLAAYTAEHPAVNALERLEQVQTKRLYEVCRDLGLCAAGLFLEGGIAALSIGEVVGETLLIHVEKALSRYEGIYPAMFSGFVRLVGETLGTPLRFVNREDDSGDPGLRTSKLQYHPISIAHKYLVHVKSPALRMEPGTILARKGVVLTELREEDRQAYLRLNTDVENNRFWGYDYREDVSITGPIDEDTFFESVRYDMRAGDSVNFALRLEEQGPMIGEAVLWNFTSDGTAELGCRVLPEYQGKGFGTAAFGVAADFAVRVLGVKLTARCYRSNAASYRMITASGFVPLRSDDQFFYFEYQKQKN
jgi:hypothetical protein